MCNDYYIEPNSHALMLLVNLKRRLLSLHMVGVGK